MSKDVERINKCSKFGDKFFKGCINYAVEWGYLYANDCQICKTKNECKGICKHRNPCKIFVMNGEEGVIKRKRMNVNGKLHIRGTKGAAW